MSNVIDIEHLVDDPTPKNAVYLRACTAKWLEWRDATPSGPKNDYDSFKYWDTKFNDSGVQRRTKATDETINILGWREWARRIITTYSRRPPCAAWPKVDMPGILVARSDDGKTRRFTRVEELSEIQIDNLIASWTEKIRATHQRILAMTKHPQKVRNALDRMYQECLEDYEPPMIAPQKVARSRKHQAA